MPLRVNTNVSGINTQRHLRITNTDLTKRIERLSSGLRVNRAADDAAGLSVSEGLRAEVSGFLQGIRNSEQATNLLQVAEGALNEVNGLLIRMRELAVQSSNSTINNSNRESLNAEFTQLVNEIDRIGQVTSYNNTSLLSGYGNAVSANSATSTAVASPTTGVIATQITGASTGTYTFIDNVADNRLTLGSGIATQTINLGTALDFDAVGGAVATGSAIIANFDRLSVQLTVSGQRPAEGINPASDGFRDGDLDGLALLVESGAGGSFQIGPDDGAVHRIQASIRDMRASGNNLNRGSASVSTAASSQNVISSIDLAISAVVRTRGDLGAIQNRLSANINANSVMAENDQASDATIRDADVAAEVSALTRSQIFNQAGLSMLAQGNLSAASVLNLL
jgi:flagellin